jgi:hypothetical protein
MGCKLARKSLALCLAISVQVLVAEAGLLHGTPAMYVLGDSILDVGNNNYLPGAGAPRPNRPYYGIDFPGRIPTGRFSNGFNTADYVGAYVYTCSVGVFANKAYISICMYWKSSLIDVIILAHTAAKTMGLVLSPPPFLLLAPNSFSLLLAALTTGVNYASGGAGILDSTVSLISYTS